MYRYISTKNIKYNSFFYIFIHVTGCSVHTMAIVTLKKKKKKKFNNITVFFLIFTYTCHKVFSTYYGDRYSKKKKKKCKSFFFGTFIHVTGCSVHTMAVITLKKKKKKNQEYKSFFFLIFT